MCLAVPGKVVKIEGKKAIIAYFDQERQAMVAETRIKKGDWVMVQMGIIVKKLTDEEARGSLEAWEEKK